VLGEVEELLHPLKKEIPPGVFFVRRLLPIVHPQNRIKYRIE